MHYRTGFFAMFADFLFLSHFRYMRSVSAKETVKRLVTCVCLGLILPVLSVGSASAMNIAGQGIWKTDDGSVSMFLQKYDTGSCVVVVTTGDGTFVAFLDTDWWEDGIDVYQDVGGNANKFYIGSSTDTPDTRIAIMTLPGFFLAQTATRMFPSDFTDSEPKSGIWKSEDNALSMYLQKYATGSCVLVITTGDGVYTAFLDPDFTNGISMPHDLSNGPYTVDVTPEAENRVTVTATLPGRGTLTRSMQYVFAEVPDLELDSDGDGLSSVAGDCDDQNDTVHPGADEICGDGVDQDCDGSDTPCQSNDPPVFAASYKHEIDYEYDNHGILIDGTLTLTQNASDPDGDALTYAWNITDGCGAILSQTGPQVVVDLCLLRGSFMEVTLEVSVSDGHGNTIKKSFKFK